MDHPRTQLTPHSRVNTKPAQLEMALSAAAAAADRANRPASLLTFPAVILAAACLFALWSYSRLARERTLLIAAQSQTVKIEDTIQRIKNASAADATSTALYPPAPFFGSQIEEVWKNPSIGFSETPQISQVASNRVDTNSSLMRNDVSATVNNEPIDKVFAAVDGTFEHQHLKDRVFITQLLLTPTGTGWRATTRFSLYVQN